MLMAKIMRILRNKIVLACICSLLIFYMSISYLWTTNWQEETDYIGGGSGTIRRPQEFKWFQDEVANDTNSIMNFCRNSIQGKVLMADDQGYVCLRADLYSTTGCCRTNGQKTQRYSCETCNDHGCCSIYEYCVSCCLHPDKKVLLKRILGVSKQNPLLASVSDHFELCLVKCRTSSQSVQHETHYRDPKAKHCYGEGPPPIVNADT